MACYLRCFVNGGILSIENNKIFWLCEIDSTIVILGTYLINVLWLSRKQGTKLPTFYDSGYLQRASKLPFSSAVLVHSSYFWQYCCPKKRSVLFFTFWRLFTLATIISTNVCWFLFLLPDSELSRFLQKNSIKLLYVWHTYIHSLNISLCAHVVHCNHVLRLQ